MATYNKRGYKAPKPKEANEVEPTDENFDGNSTTAEVFDTLDQGASKTEEWVEKNQKMIFVIVGAIALLTVGYVMYNKFLVEPKEEEAANEMFQAEQYFAEAVNATTANDSLYTLSLNGGEGKMGFIDIIDNYSGTDAANLAHYFAGMAYLNTGKYAEAVKQFDEFNTSEEVLKAMAAGATGDAFAQLGQTEDALDYYTKAANETDNDLTTPRFLFKAGEAALELGKKDVALKHFKQIKEKYSTAPEAVTIDAYIAMTEE
ncbi:tetratricopeptide repeat protein [Flavobacterium litorale]|uniref:Tetratricopeptide repeat protein n=1 Tax=Flavobacterium litorale TaxID=2856519 RepID=A0ABX8V6E6_9FLAO|nr:tetratricopeptide repeat protein [Flavobacterium litorale]QYJ68322.1 tetratricopeptide repeat protein [Flavobacterium litorale]